MPTTSINFLTKAIQTLLPVVCGIPESALNGISPQYVVRIIATFGKQFAGSKTELAGGTPGLPEFTVYGFLQDKIVLTAGAEWKGLAQSMPGDVQNYLQKVDLAAQAAAGRSAIFTPFTRRVWAGSNPISIRMKLKFEAYDDPSREVFLPCMGLQGLTLPRGGVAENSIGLIPPGPNPFDFSWKGSEASERNESISLNIGGFLNFDSVIVKDVAVTFENRMSLKGPVGAEVDITVESYQMLTREDLMKVISSNLAQFSLGQTVGQGIPTATPEGLAG